MNTQWFREYVHLAFRIDKAIRTFSESFFVDYYYGPVEWRAEVEDEAVSSATDLLRAAGNLLDTLPSQNLEQHRVTYLVKHVLAMETICKKLNGEMISLEDEVQGCYDVHPIWTPEAQFEQAFVLGESVLPGEGSLSERMNGLRKHYELTWEKVELVIPFLQRALAEAQRRTQTFVNLPTEEEVSVQTVTEKPWVASNNYLGNYRSRIDLNTDLPINLDSLLYTMSHEGYPGHHTEFALKEQFLYNAYGYREQAIGLMISPQIVMSEGIATLASSIIFTPNEEQAWLAEHVYPEAHIEPISIDWEKLRQVSELLMGVRGNAAMLFREGYPDTEILQYLIHHMMITKEIALKMLAFLKRPFRDTLVFAYLSGKQLMRPWLQSADRLSVFHGFLTRQIYPSELVKEECIQPENASSCD